MLEAEKQYWTIKDQIPTPCDVDSSQSEAFEYVEARAQDALLNFPQNREGLSLERVNSFAKAHNLHIPPLIFIDKPQTPLINGILGLLQTEPFNENAAATYYPAHNYVIALRGTDDERQNGSESMEANVVHEIAHANQSKQVRTVRWPIGSGYVLGREIFRHGLRVRRSSDRSLEGSFFTEAHAELLRAEFMEKELDRPYGFGGDAREIREWDYGDFIHTLPTKYTSAGRPVCIRKDPRTIAASYTSYAAYAFEILSEKDPEVIPLLCQAMESVEGIRPFISSLERIKPGLYPSLRRLPNTASDFTNGLREAINTAGKW